MEGLVRDAWWIWSSDVKGLFHEWWLRVLWFIAPIPVAARSKAWVDWFLGLRVRFPPEAWKFVRNECCVLSGTGLCVGPINCATNPIEWGVSNEGHRETQYRQVITRNRVEIQRKKCLTQVLSSFLCRYEERCTIALWVTLKAHK